MDEQTDKYHEKAFSSLRNKKQKDKETTIEGSDTCTS